MNTKIIFQKKATNVAKHLLAILLMAMLYSMPFTTKGQKTELSKESLTSSHYDKQFFIKNTGQWPSEVLFMSQLNGLDAWITKTGVTYDLFTLNTTSSKAYRNTTAKKETSGIEGQVVRINLVGSNANSELTMSNICEGKHNYLLGKDASKWVKDVPLYKQATIKNIYNGIDQEFYFDNGKIRYDYIVKQGADAKQIKMKIEGSNSAVINEQGDLVLSTKLGDIKQAKLFTYQEVDGKRLKIESNFMKNNNGTFGFEIGDYDVTKPLIIDPLAYSTFIGGTSIDEGWGLAVDAAGCAYLAGGTWSANYPTTVGAFQTSLNSSFADGVVTKLNANGSALIYSTFFGSTGWDWFKEIDINSAGEVYVTGETNSTTFPTTTGAFSTVNFGAYDAVVAVLNANGNGLLYSTYLGGISDEYAKDIKITTNSDVFYVTGNTTSSNFPTTLGALYNTYQTAGDVYVCRFDKSIFGAGSLTQSTYLGGSENDEPESLFLDNAGDVYLTGGTYSSNYPSVLIGTAAPTPSVNNVFVSKLNGTLSSLLYSLNFGSSNSDAGTAIVVNTIGEAFITGAAGAVDFYTSLGTWSGGPSDIFVAKINSSGTVVTTRLLGGAGAEVGRDITLFDNEVYIGGETSSLNFPTTIDAFSTVFLGGVFDVFITKLDIGLTNIIYSTYFGGNQHEITYALCVKEKDIVYFTGWAFSSNYPTTNGAFLTTHSGMLDSYVTKLDFNPCIGAPTNAVYYYNPISSTTFPGTTSTLPITPIVLAGTFTIDQNTNLLNNPNVFLKTDAKIVLENSTTFTINSSSIQGCQNMWDGIYAEDGDKHLIISSSNLNDMKNGLVVSKTATLNTQNSIYSNNYQSMWLRNMINSNALIILNNSIQGVGTLLKPPYIGQLPKYGIRLNSCYNINIGIGTNANSKNDFNTLKCGILLENDVDPLSPTTQIINLYNNQFKNIIGSNYVSPFPTEGWSVYATNNHSARNFTVNIIGNENAVFNHIENCHKGIFLRATTSTVKQNKMQNVGVGVYMLSPLGRNYSLLLNTIINTQLGLCKIGDEGQLGIKISGNRITLSAMTAPIFGETTSTAIKSRYSSISHVGKTTINDVIPVSGGISYVPNVINIPMPDNGIGISLENGKRDGIENNQIHLLATTGIVTPTVPNLLGIYSNVSDNLTIKENIIDNNNSVNSNTSYVPGNNAGIYLYNNTNSILKCNNTNYVKYGILCAGLNGSSTDYTRTVRNTMRASSYDMLFWELGTPGSLGLIGKEILNGNYDANNQFLGSPSYKVFRNNTPTGCLPTGYAEGIVTALTKVNPSQSSALYNAPTCKYVISNPSTFTTIYNDCGGISNIAPSIADDVDINLANLIANDAIDYEEDFDEGARRADEELLFNWLEANAGIRNNNPVLNAFYLARYSETIGELNSIDRAIATLSEENLIENEQAWITALEDAKTQNQNLVTEVVFDTHAKEINRLHLKVIELGTETLNTAEKEFIETLANTCPLTHGNAVYRARALQGLYSPAKHYDDIVICNSQGVNKNGKTKLQQQLEALANAEHKATLIDNGIVVYPIPTSNMLNIEYVLDENETAIFYIYDLLGNIIQKVSLNGLTNKVVLDLSKHTSGIYTYKFVSSKNKNHTGKIILE